MRNFAREQGIRYYYEVGRSGISHQLLPEQRLIHPQDVVFGADSHSTTYGALGCFATGVGSTEPSSSTSTSMATPSAKSNAKPIIPKPVSNAISLTLFKLRLYTGKTSPKTKSASSPKNLTG